MRGDRILFHWMDGVDYIFGAKIHIYSCIRMSFIIYFYCLYRPALTFVRFWHLFCTIQTLFQSGDIVLCRKNRKASECHQWNAVKDRDFIQLMLLQSTSTGLSWRR